MHHKYKVTIKLEQDGEIVYSEEEKTTSKLAMVEVFSRAFRNASILAGFLK